MTSGEIIDVAVRSYRQQGWTFLKATVVPSIFCLAGLTFFQSYVLPAFFTTSSGSSITGQISEVIVAMVLGLLLGGPLLLLGLSYSCALVVHLTSDFMLGNAPSIERATQATKAVLRTMMWVSMRELLLAVSGIVISALLMLAGGFLSSTSPDSAILPAVVAVVGILGILAGIGVFLYVVSLHALTPAICVLEQSNAKLASQRSRDLLKNRKQVAGATGIIWNVYLLLGFVALIEAFGWLSIVELLGISTHVEQILRGVPLHQLLLKAIEILPDFLIVWTLVPFWATCITIIYYERRIRIEGYDIEALAADIAKGSHASRFQL